MATQDEVHGFPTRATYRALLVRGFTAGEAANLTAYMAGIEVGSGRPWRLADVDRLLFLRELCRTGRLGADDGLGANQAPAVAAAPAAATAPAATAPAATAPAAAASPAPVPPATAASA